MCEYCEDKELYTDYIYMSSLPILDDFDEKPFKDLDEICQYIRKSKENKTYNLITEFPNDNGDVINLPINYCPMCGRKLGGK